MLMAGAVPSPYEASINVLLFFKVSLKVKEEVSTLKWRGNCFWSTGNQMRNAIQFKVKGIIGVVKRKVIEP